MIFKRFENWVIQASTRPWFDFVLLILITMLAAGLRFYKLGEWSFWFDEIFTINHARAHFSSLQLILDHIPPARNWVPTSVILTAQALNKFGVSEWSARLVSSIIGILSIPILYFPIKKIFGYQVSLITLIIIAIHPWHLFWSQNSRFYSALMLFTILAFFSFFYAFERDRPVFIILGYGIFYLALSERLTALLVFPAFLVYLIVQYLLPMDKPPGYRRRNYILIITPMLVFIILELFLFFTNNGSLAQDLLETFGGNRGPSPLFLLYRIILGISVPITSLAVIGGLFLLLSKTRRGLFLVSFAFTPIVLILVLNPFMFTDDRYVFVVLPGWIILAAVTICEISDRLIRTNNGALFSIALPLLVGFVFMFADARYYQSNNGYRLNWRGAFELVASHQINGDVVASYWPELADYYIDQQTVPMQTLRPTDLVLSDNRYWFVIDDYAIWSAQNISRWVEENCEMVMFDELLVERPEMLRVYLCEPAYNDFH